MGRRIHVLGASGVGSSTLARALADRLALMEEVLVPRCDLVLAGSLMGWGDALIPRFTHVVFLTPAPAKRLARPRRRERQRLGAAIAPPPGGALEADHRALMDYAMGYDMTDFTGRNRAKHALWLEDLPCPVIRQEAVPPVETLLAQTLAALDPAADSA